MRKFISHTAAPSLCLCFLLKKQTHKDIVICHRPDKINHGYTAQDNPGNRHTSSSPDTARGLGKSHKSQKSAPEFPGLSAGLINMEMIPSTMDATAIPL